MLNYIILGIIVLGGILQFIHQLQKEGSRWKMAIGGSLIIIGIIGGWVNFQVTQEQKRESALEGDLLPRKMFRYGNNLIVRIAENFHIATVDELGMVRSPIKNLSKSLTYSISGDGPIISATVRDSRNEIIAVIENNHWTTNPNNVFRRNYDQYGFEVMDNSGVIVLQLDTVGYNEIRVNGVFYTEKECVVITDSGIYSLLKDRSPTELLSRDELMIKPIFIYNKEGVGGRSKYGLEQHSKYVDDINRVEELRMKLYSMTDKEIKHSLHNVISDLENLWRQFNKAEKKSPSQDIAYRKVNELMNVYRSKYRDYIFLDKDLNRRIQLKKIPKERSPKLMLPGAILLVNNDFMVALILKYLRQIDALL